MIGDSENEGILRMDSDNPAMSGNNASPDLQEVKRGMPRGEGKQERTRVKVDDRLISLEYRKERLLRQRDLPHLL